MAPYGRPALVNGRPGAVVILGDRVVSAVAFTIDGGRVVGMDLLADPERLSAVRV
jgi:RNA polymerase sigma-70 factor (ECF subfamily)